MPEHDPVAQLRRFAIELRRLAYTGHPDKEAVLLTMSERMHCYAAQVARTGLTTGDRLQGRTDR